MTRGFLITVVLMSTSSVIHCLIPQLTYCQGATSGCDFSRYRPLVVSHPLVNAAIKRVEPEYPEIARKAKIQGKVEVRILVDRKGNVVNTCIVEGHPMLSPAAQRAARQWRFKKNLGLSPKQRRRYIEASLFFTFQLDA